MVHEGDNRKGRSDYRLGIGGKIQKFETWPPSGSEYRPNLRGGGIDLRFCDTPTRAFMNKLEELEHLFKAAERNESRLHQVRMGEMCHRGLTTVSGYHVCVTTAVDHLARDAIQAHPWKSGVIGSSVTSIVNAGDIYLGVHASTHPTNSYDAMQASHGHSQPRRPKQQQQDNGTVHGTVNSSSSSSNQHTCPDVDQP